MTKDACSEELKEALKNAQRKTLQPALKQMLQHYHDSIDQAETIPEDTLGESRQAALAALEEFAKKHGFTDSMIQKLAKISSMEPDSFKPILKKFKK